MIRAHLIVYADVSADTIAEKFAQGPVDITVTHVEIRSGEELLRHDLRPQLIEAAASSAVNGNLPDERTGPLVRVFATRPDKEA